MAVDKLVDSAQLNAGLTALANAIRTRGGTAAPLSFPSGMAQAVADIPAGVTPLAGFFTLTEDWTETVTIYAENMSQYSRIAMVNVKSDYPLREMLSDNYCFPIFATNYTAGSSSPRYGYVVRRNVNNDWLDASSDNVEFIFGDGYVQVTSVDSVWLGGQYFYILW